MLRSKADYIADCELKESHLRARKLATDAELDEHRPGSKRAPIEEWVFWWGQLVGYCRRQENSELGFQRGEADEVAAQALSGAPCEIPLRPASDTAPALKLAVHPKSFVVLFEWFHQRELMVRLLADKVEQLRQTEDFDHIDVLEKAAAELSYQTRLLAYAACTPGPGLPFALDATDIELPAPFTDLYATELVRINEAFMWVNAGQLKVLDRLIAPAKRGNPSDGPSYSIFFGQLSMRLKRPAAELMRDQALVQYLATVKLAAPQPGDREDELEGAGV